MKAVRGKKADREKLVCRRVKAQKNEYSSKGKGVSVVSRLLWLENSRRWTVGALLNSVHMDKTGEEKKGGRRRRR